ncbi:MAG: Gfo/Idh/MocA family oxidoreductase [Planctomycetota bacterium]|nr:Gfo/Idh/MocA family oxidoreductase [Planctomycetota bacterium]
MSGKLRVGLIGCGGRGRAHLKGYAAAPGVELAACADISAEGAKKAADEYKIPKTYADYRELLAEEKPDVVSIALWTGLHLEAILACVEAPKPPKLINAEKPMAPTYGEARRMHQACEEAGIALTFSHQRRFGPPFVRAKELLEAGELGEPIRLEAHCPNLFDWGTHWFDMLFYFNKQQPVDWVLGQIDATEARNIFGTLVESSGLSLFQFANGVQGLHVTGQARRTDLTEVHAIGTKGRLEVNGNGLRVLREGRAWESVEGLAKEDGWNDTVRYIVDSIECLQAGRPSILCSANALMATELIFATYESSRRRAKVKLPLLTDESALLSMAEQGELVLPASVTEFAHTRKKKA